MDLASAIRVGVQLLTLLVLALQTVILWVRLVRERAGES